MPKLQSLDQFRQWNKNLKNLLGKRLWLCKISRPDACQSHESTLKSSWTGSFGHDNQRRKAWNQSRYFCRCHWAQQWMKNWSCKRYQRELKNTGCQNCTYNQNKNMRKTLFGWMTVDETSRGELRDSKLLETESKLSEQIEVNKQLKQYLEIMLLKICETTWENIIICATLSVSFFLDYQELYT